MLIIVILGVISFCLVPSGLGTANVRPIEDFTDTNTDIMPNLAAWSDPQSNLILIPHYLLETIADCDPEGFVLEKDLKDGRILYKIDLHVKDAVCWVFWNDGGYWYLNPPIFTGKIDYYFTVTMIVYDGDFGGPVPNIWQVWFPGMFPGDPIGEGTLSHMALSGTGTFTEYSETIGQGFIAGETAKVTMNMVGILKSEDDFEYLIYPVEIIFFH